MTNPKVDIGILTVREDEFLALLAAFPQKAGTFAGPQRQYALRVASANPAGTETYSVAILRAIEQGNGEAQAAARDMIEDVSPALLLVVGIAGALPSLDYTLGDVVIATRINDYCVSAKKENAESEYNLAGGPMVRKIAAGVSNLHAREDDLGDWTATLPALPTVTWKDRGRLYGPERWRKDLRQSLEHHFGGESPRARKFKAGTIASSDVLIKDPKLLFPWISTARHLLAVEMESGGVFRATQERCMMLAIRGISDIVGLKRDDAWTKFACASAASFARAYLLTHPIAPRGPDAATGQARKSTPHGITVQVDEAKEVAGRGGLIVAASIANRGGTDSTVQNVALSLDGERLRVSDPFNLQVASLSPFPSTPFILNADATQEGFWYFGPSASGDGETISLGDYRKVAVTVTDGMGRDTSADVYVAQGEDTRRDQDARVFRDLDALVNEEWLEGTLSWISSQHFYRDSHCDPIRRFAREAVLTRNRYFAKVIRKALWDLVEKISTFVSYLELHFFVWPDRPGGAIDSFALYPNLNSDRGGAYDKKSQSLYDRAATELNEATDAVLNAYRSYRLVIKRELGL